MTFYSLANPDENLGELVRFKPRFSSPFVSAFSQGVVCLSPAQTEVLCFDGFIGVPRDDFGVILDFYHGLTECEGSYGAFYKTYYKVLWDGIGVWAEEGELDQYDPTEKIPPSFVGEGDW